MPKVSEEYSGARRQQIIDAAYRCFARKGFHAATMRDIYAEAGLSPGAVYHYFDSKDDIIEASIANDLERSLPELEGALDHPDPLEALDRLIDFFYAGLESAAALGADRVNIQGWGEALVNPRLYKPLRATLDTFHARLAQLVRRGQASGAIRSHIDAEAAAQVVLSSFLGLYLQKALIPSLDVACYKDIVRALVHGTFAGSD